MSMKLESIAVIAAVGAAAIAVLYIAKKGVAGAAAGAVGAAADAASGTVVGIGQVFGVPATNETACEKAKREGRTWDASFACPAGDFIGHVWGRITGSADGDAAQAKYQRPAQTSNTQAGDSGATPLGFYVNGGSFKDMADPYGVNGFRDLKPAPLGQLTL